MNDLKGIIEDCNKSDLVSDNVIKKVIEIIGQEEWQILHDENNDVCTTMGELIITLKGIADLEKENKNLESIAEHQQSSNMKRYFEIEELKKENAELKAQLESERDLPAIAYMQGAEKQKKKDEDQLTNAKEIISEYINMLKGDTKNWKKTQEKAEQFLKDCEVEK